MNNYLLAINLGTGTIFTIVIVAIIIILILYVISVYNRLVNVRELVRNAMGNISAQIESRWDALKSMIDATKKYSEHEAKVLIEVVQARSGITNTSSAKEVEKDDAIFNQALQRLNIVLENYPELKANTLYIKTMENIDKYENNVRMSRMVYNDTVTKLNRSVQQFPSSIIASMFGFHQETYFQNSETKSEMPQW